MECGAVKVDRVWRVKNSGPADEGMSEVCVWEVLGMGFL